MSVSEGTIAAFYAAQWLTPIDKAVIVEAMMHLGNAGQRESSSPAPRKPRPIPRASPTGARPN
jgi:hypothetical protein